MNRSKLPLILSAMALLLAISLYVPKLTAQSEMTFGRDGKTVFIDTHIGKRRDHASEHMSQMHQNMAAEGFTIIDVEPWIENGDLEGFYLTYVREK